MAKQIIKGLSMLMLVVALAFVTSVVSAYGQSSRQVATIPFQFSVGDKDLPAGQYDVAGIAGHDAVVGYRLKRNDNFVSEALRADWSLTDDLQWTTLLSHLRVEANGSDDIQSGFNFYNLESSTTAYSGKPR